MRSLGALFLVVAAAATAQWPGDQEIPPVDYPTVPVVAAKPAGFAPKGWKVEAEATGDLNGDKLTDIALVLHMDDPANRISTSWDKDFRYDTNPRMLVVAFGQPGGGYRLVVGETKLISRLENPNQDDPFDSIEIRNGVLRLKLHVFMSAGGWWMGNFQYTFRWQDGAFKMIGYDRDGVQRNTGETDRVSINYVTRTKLVESGNIDGTTGKSQRSRLPAKPLLTMSAIGDGLMFWADEK